MDNETRFWIVIALMAIPLVLRFGMGVFLFWFWRVFDKALSEGRVKFTYGDAEEKVKCHYSDCEQRGDPVKGDEQVTCPLCRDDLGLDPLP